MKYFFSILLCLGISQAWAQEQDTTIVLVADTVERAKMQSTLIPASLRIGPAVNSLIQSAIDSDGTYYGFQGDLVMGRFMLSAEYGHMDLKRQSEAGVAEEDAFQYESNGSFYKFGIDVNLLRDKQKNNFDAIDDVIYFGLKYAISNINDQVSFRTPDNFWGNTAITEANDNLGVHWIEINAGVKVALYKNIFLGYTMRYRFGLRYTDNSSLEPYRIPGFGNGQDNSNFGFDYYIFYRIPFRKR